MIRRALPVLLAALASCGGSGLPLVLTVDLGAPGLEDDFTIVDEAGLWSVGEFGPGLRVVKPADPGGAGFVHGGVRSIFQLNGGFEVTVTFDLLEFPAPSGDGVNEAVLAVSRSDERVFRVVRRSDAAGERVLAFQGETLVAEAPSALLRGRLRIRRVSTSSFIAEIAPPDGAFTTLVRVDHVYSGAARVQLLGRQGSDTGAPRTALDLCFPELVLGATSITGLSERLRPSPPL